MARTSAGRVAALTGLRGLAASSVVFYHVWLYGAPQARSFPSGPLQRVFANLEMGVTFFFVLSGFLLYRSYGRALLTGGTWPRLRNFAISRFLRIVPAYWVALLVTVLLTERGLLALPWRLLANVFFLEFCFPSFLPHNLGTSNGSIAIVPTWSLAVEAAFYVSLPPLALLARRMARDGRRVAAAFLPPVALALIGLGSTIVEQLLHGNARRSWEGSFPLHAGWFACGMAATVMFLLYEEERLRLPARVRGSVVLVALALIAASIKLHYLGRLGAVDYQWPIAVSLALLLLLVACADDDSRIRSLLSSRALVATGVASYSIFLVHDPVIRELRDRQLAGESVGGFLITLALVGAATAALTTISYGLLERPGFALKRRLTAPGATVLPPGALGRRLHARERLVPVLRQLVGTIDANPDGRWIIAAGAARWQRVDARALEPVVLPLLENAVAYGEPPFVIEACRQHDRLRLAVTDTGRGVDDAFARHLFEPFARSEQSRHVPGEGTGLTVARMHARDLGGDLAYVPTSGHGARFEVTLRRHERHTGARRLRRIHSASQPVARRQPRRAAEATDAGLPARQPRLRRFRAPDVVQASE